MTTTQHTTHHTNPKESNTMHDTTAQPTTAADARRLAEQLEQTERELGTRQRAARRDAETAACRAEFDHADHDLEPARVAALARWEAATQADELDHAELFAAFIGLRTATLERIETLRTADARLTALAPRRHDISGQPVAYRADTYDGDAAAQWSDVLDRVVRAHLERRAHGYTDATNQRIAAAGQTAADATS